VTEDLLDRVRAAWAEALDLDIEAVPLDVSFFEAGGNSLLLLLLSEQLSELTSRELTVGELFQHSTVRAQTAFLTAPATPSAPSARIGATARGNLLGRAEGAR
jgi:hypothetical protein